MTEISNIAALSENKEGMKSPRIWRASKASLSIPIFNMSTVTNTKPSYGYPKRSFLGMGAHTSALIFSLGYSLAVGGVYLPWKHKAHHAHLHRNLCNNMCCNHTSYITSNGESIRMIWYSWELWVRLWRSSLSYLIFDPCLLKQTHFADETKLRIMQSTW